MSLSITVSVNDMLYNLKKNKDQHVKEYTEARQVYLKKVLEETEKVKARAENFLTDSETKFPKNAFHVISLSVPIDNRDQYNTFIGMLEMHSRNGSINIDLDVKDYKNIVEDSWDWAAAGKMINSSYTSQ